MAHVLILGQTESGKTTLARTMAGEYRARGIKVIVHDPLNDPRWQADFKSTDFLEFMRVYWASRSCAAFFDESGDSAQAFPAQFIKTATRGRHWGHKNHYIGQRAVLIPRTARDQCSNIFLFNSSLEDCKIHAAEWNEPAFRDEAPSLEKGQYFYKARMGTVFKSKIF